MAQPQPISQPRPQLSQATPANPSRNSHDSTKIPQHKHSEQPPFGELMGALLGSLPVAEFMMSVQNIATQSQTPQTVVEEVHEEPLKVNDASEEEEELPLLEVVVDQSYGQACHEKKEEGEQKTNEQVENVKKEEDETKMTEVKKVEEIKSEHELKKKGGRKKSVAFTID
jgi:hypothetical protein